MGGKGCHAVPPRKQISAKLPDYAKRFAYYHWQLFTLAAGSVAGEKYS